MTSTSSWFTPMNICYLEVLFATTTNFATETHKYNLSLNVAYSFTDTLTTYQRPNPSKYHSEDLSLQHIWSLSPLSHDGMMDERVSAMKIGSTFSCS